MTNQTETETAKEKISKKLDEMMNEMLSAGLELRLKEEKNKAAFQLLVEFFKKLEPAESAAFLLAMMVKK